MEEEKGKEEETRKTEIEAEKQERKEKKEIEKEKIEPKQVEEIRETKTEEELIEERKKRLKNFLKRTNLWVLGFLIIALILGVYIRSLPMQDHDEAPASLLNFIFTPWQVFDGQPGLWDITTNTWTLGPDLDPWLFTRYAETIIEKGSLPAIDTMRNVPLGFDTSTELQMVSYMIVLTHKIVNLFGIYSINFAAALMPVLAFALTIITFFLFVREIFIRKDKETKTKANIIALISTFFMIVIPTFLSRTVAGIPEKESIAFFFMFLTFYLFLRAWKTQKLKNALILGILAGISTGLMGMSWGGVNYIYVTIGIACFLAFILGKTSKKEFIICVLWFVISVTLLSITSKRYSILGFLQSTSNLTVTFTIFVMLIHFILWHTKLKRFFPENTKLPKNLWSVIFSIILGCVLVSLFFGIDFIPNKINGLIQTFIKPVTGRWSVTVAENRQPYFTEWGASFGPFIKNIPVMFWLFFVGSIVLFKKMFSSLKKKDSWILTGLYVLFFFGLVFSRYSGSSIFNGESFISKLFYFGSALLLIGSLIYYYIKYYREKNNSFEKIDYEYLLLFSLFALCLFTARSAVRLIMVLAPIAPIFLSYLITESSEKFRKTKDSTWKIVLGAIVILILILSIFTFWNYYNSIKAQSYSFIPSYYNQQWQKAMVWVKENTSREAVFAHWWDYGYWVQSIGNRATVTDGGNAVVWWNYLTGRLVLTGDNEKDALEFLYAHNATHLLIDSTDIGKYTAFSSIGSNENYDRYSWIPVMVSDERQIQETKTGTKRIYQGGAGLDEDIIYKKNETEISLPEQRAAIIGVILEVAQKGDSILFKQPEAIFYYQGVQQTIPLKCLYYNNKLYDFEEGIGGCVYIMQRVYQTDTGMRVDNLGALMYLSPRLMRGLLTQVYLLNDSFDNFPAFKLVHIEQNLIIENLNSQGLGLNEFIYFNGVQGPIKIWKINYTGKEEIKEEYLDRDASKYISWSL